MPPLSNPRQEAFAQVAATGTTLIEAHEKAGYVPDYGNASRLTAKDSVRERIHELQWSAADLAQVTVASLVARADESRRNATADKQHSAAVAAIKEIGILTGLRIDRREVGSPGEFARMDDEELRLFIASENAKLIEIPDET